MNNYNTENRLRYFSVFVPCTNDPLPYPCLLLYPGPYPTTPSFTKMHSVIIPKARVDGLLHIGHYFITGISQV